MTNQNTIEYTDTKEYADHVEKTLIQQKEELLLEVYRAVQATKDFVVTLNLCREEERKRVDKEWTRMEAQSNYSQTILGCFLILLFAQMGMMVAMFPAWSQRFDYIEKYQREVQQKVRQEQPKTSISRNDWHDVALICYQGFPELRFAVVHPLQTRRVHFNRDARPSLGSSRKTVPQKRG